MSDTIELSETAIEQIADRVAAKLQSMPHSKPVLTAREAMVFTNHRSLQSFYRWTKRHHVQPLERGRYSRRRLEVALGTGGTR